MQNVVALGDHKFIVLVIALELNLGIPLDIDGISAALEIALLASLQIGEGSDVAAAGRGGTWANVKELVRVPVDGRRRCKLPLVWLLGAVLYLPSAQVCAA